MFRPEPEEQDGGEAQQVDGQVPHDEQAQAASKPGTASFKLDLTKKTLNLSQKPQQQRKQQKKDELAKQKQQRQSNLSKSKNHVKSVYTKLEKAANQQATSVEKHAHQDLAQRHTDKVFSFDTGAEVEQIDGVARGGAREEDKDTEAAANIEHEDMYCDRDYDSDFEVYGKDPCD